MKQIRLFTLFLSILIAAPTLQALEIEGVSLPESVMVDGKTVQLNGAGIRTKFFFDIYIGALYLETHTTSAKAVLIDPGAKRISMDFLYGEVEKEKLRDGWKEGFRKNQLPERMAVLQPRLERFNALFSDAHRGDKVTFDLFTDGTTHIQINGKESGVIEGADFQQALLAVWLGKKPADGDLKMAMLGR